MAYLNRLSTAADPVISTGSADTLAALERLADQRRVRLAEQAQEVARIVNFAPHFRELLREALDLNEEEEP